MPLRINNSDAYKYVRDREDFTGSNMYAYTLDSDGKSHSYIVLSYGVHFPMYVYDYDTNKWIGNKDKYSRTTTRHQSQARPPRVDVWVDTYTIKEIASHPGGYAGYLTDKLTRKAA